MTNFLPSADTNMPAKSPVAAVRRLVISVQSKLGLSAWCYSGVTLGLTIMVGSMFLQGGFTIMFGNNSLEVGFAHLLQIMGALVLIFALFKGVFELGDDNMVSREVRASDDVKLINQGVPNPSRHRKQNPELVAAYESLAIELGASPESLAHRTEESSQYDAALLVLSGRVALEDSHLIVSAVRKGCTDSEEIVSMVNEMKAHGYALAEGAL